MTPQLEIVAPGTLASIQDRGRFGFRRFGVPQSGVLHPDLAQIANALAGNTVEAAVLEFFLSGPTLRVTGGSVRLALVGDFRIELLRRSKKYLLGSWRSITLNPGDILRVGVVLTGKAGYIAIAGGVAAEQVMGSRSTYLRGGFGGLDGKRLLAGGRLPLALPAPPPGPEHYLPRPPAQFVAGSRKGSAEEHATVAIRVILGPQDDYFTDEALQTFLSAEYTVAPESDRMGSRLIGPLLTHRPERRPEIVSDGVVPGAIQVPGNGAPIVLLADGPTVGGYPKIATIATVDLARMAVLAPGGRVRFQAITVEEAETCLQGHREFLDSVLAAIKPLKLTAGVDLDALYATDLVGGVVSANRCKMD